MPRIKYFATTHYTGLLSKNVQSQPKKGITWRTLPPSMRTSFYINIDKSFFSRHYSLHPPSFYLFSSRSLSLSLARCSSSNLIVHDSFSPHSALFSSSSSSDWVPTAAVRLDDVEKGHALGHRHDGSSRRYKYTAHV